MQSSIVFGFVLMCLAFGPISGLSPNRRLVIRGGLGDGGIPSKECSGLDRNGFNKLNKICDDCFALFKEPEIYTLCRNDCFGSRFFYGCMEALLVKDELKTEVAAYLDDFHTSNYGAFNNKK